MGNRGFQAVYRLTRDLLRLGGDLGVMQDAFAEVQAQAVEAHIATRQPVRKELCHVCKRMHFAGNNCEEATEVEPVAGIKSKELAALLDAARKHTMTNEEQEAQRQSWVRGEMAIGTDADEERWKEGNGLVGIKSEEGQSDEGNKRVQRNTESSAGADPGGDLCDGRDKPALAPPKQKAETECDKLHAELIEITAHRCALLKQVKRLEKYEALYADARESLCSCNLADLTAEPGSSMNYTCEWCEQNPDGAEAPDVIKRMWAFESKVERLQEALRKILNVAPVRTGVSTAKEIARAALGENGKEV